MNYKYKQRLKLNIKCNAHFEVDQHDNCINISLLNGRMVSILVLLYFFIALLCLRYYNDNITFD